jgi:hypothetical protein
VRFQIIDGENSDMQDDKVIAMLFEIKEFMGEVKKTLEIIPKHEERICTLESAPGKRWNALVITILNSLISSGIGAGIVMIFKK